MLNQSLGIYQLHLAIGLGIVKFGENRETIVSRLGEPDFSEIDEDYKTDYYDFRSLHVQYDYKTLKCVSIQIFPPAKVMYGGLDLLGLKYDEALRWIRAMDFNVEEDENPYGSEFVGHSTQIAMNTKLYAEGAIEALFIFSEGYWPSAEEMEANVKRGVDEVLSKYKPGEAEAELERMMNEPSEIEN